MKRSPYNLLQEIYSNDPWKILVCCMFLNLTSRKQVDKIREEFFRKWSSPKQAMNADREEMRSLIIPLGLSEKRSASIIRMSREYLEKEWKNPIELHGIGKYGQDSWDIFVNHKIVKNPSDKVLNKYINWLKNECTKS